MTRSNLIGSLILSALAASACNNSMDDEQAILKAQTEADERNLRASLEADQKTLLAQAEADKKIAEVQARFLKTQEEYREDIASRLIELDRKVAEIELQAKGSEGRAKAALDDRIQEIRGHRFDFDAEYQRMETATSSTWDEAKTRTEKSWTRLKSLVEKN